MRRLLAAIGTIFSIDRVIAIVVAVSLTTAVSTPLAVTAIEVQRENERVAALPNSVETSFGDVALVDGRFPDSPTAADAPPSGSSIEIA